LTRLPAAGELGLEFYNLEQTVKRVPYGYSVATAKIIVKDAAVALEFYTRAFGAVERFRLNVPGVDKIAHAEVAIGDAVIMLADESPAQPQSPQSLGGSTALIHLYVDDVDLFVSRAAAAGAQQVTPARDVFWGDRMAVLTDPFGHRWVICTHQQDVSPQEMQARFAALPQASNAIVA
jgi:PhnB protein